MGQPTLEVGSGKKSSTFIYIKNKLHKEYYNITKEH